MRSMGSVGGGSGVGCRKPVMVLAVVVVVAAVVGS